MDVNKSSLWDQLSEDWIEQPPPSSPQPDASQSSPPQKNAPKSRIPRLSKRRSSVGEPVSRRAPLADSSQSDINSRAHSSSPHKLRQSSQMHHSGNSRPSTGSSAGSVVHKPDQAGPGPDWKRAATKKQDLFSSAGLEELFRKPDGEPDATPAKKTFTFQEELEDMPSSPPIVVRSGSDSALSRRTSNLNHVRSLHDIAEESSDNGMPDEMPDETTAKEPSHEEAATDAPAPVRKPESAVSGSSVACDLSPVFISKHNTADGNIGYAAFDPDDIPDLGSFVNCDRGGQSEEGSFKRRPLSPSATSTPLPSDSVAPSDSVSQVHSRAFTNVQQLATQPPQLSPILESAQVSPAKQQPDYHVATPARSKNTSIETAFRATQPSQAEHVESSPRSGIPGGSSRPDTEVEATSSNSQTDAPSIVGRKRKDLRSEASHNSNHSAVTGREILRPRNMKGPRKSSIMGSLARDQQSQAQTQAAEGQKTSVATHAQFLKPVSQDEAKARALASEVASFHFKGSRISQKDPRKPSFSTQDYLNEAMKIMSLIRAKKNVESDADSSEATWPGQHQQDLSGDFSFSSQHLSRPPSREGFQSAWRSQAFEHVDPQVLNHLKKYEETGDESFLVSSVVKSVRASEREEDDMEEHEVSQMSSASHRRRRASDSDLHLGSRHEESPVKTQTSHQSTSSGRTIATTSTQRARNMTTIAPENVSHLIRDEEAGMRFDTQTGTWVKQRRSKPRPSAAASSSTGTDGNALNEIPDLSVNEGLEQERSRVFSGQHQPWPAGTSELANEESACSRPAESGSVIHQSATFDQEKRPDFAATRDELHNEESDVVPTVEADSTEELPLPPVDVQVKRRENSVLFSSPPVSREYHARYWHEAEDIDDPAHDSSELVPYRAKRDGDRHHSPRQAHMMSRTRSLSRIYEQHELSLLEDGPNGRQMSMSLSISTPIPDRRSATVPGYQSGAVSRHRSFMNSLSPLSAFSVNQTDDRHKDSLALGRSVLQVEPTHEGFRGHAAKATEGLVTKLTDAEPNEPFWDVMSRLQLSECGFENMHALDAFCPRLEYLDISSNQLEHLQGIPSSLRQANFTRNLLSNLTSWGHLSNLQYVDLSHNRLTSLEGLSGLVHLRELKADKNAVRSIEGVLDLDGLLSLSLRGNKMASVDFKTAALSRLEHVDLSMNPLTSVRGLASLPTLKSLNLDDCHLVELPYRDRMTNLNGSLEQLSLARNGLSSLNVEGFPRLRSLNVDDNRLGYIEGLSSCLCVLFMRNQKLHAGLALDDLSAFEHLQELHLSGTPLAPCLPMEKPFLQLHTLDVSFTGLQALPSDFGLLTPNLQHLNLNFNHVKDLRPLAGIAGLRHLYCANNRVSRLRSLVRVLKSLSALRGGVLSEVDFRGNPVVIGFYHALDKDGNHTGSTRGLRSSWKTSMTMDLPLSRLMGMADAEADCSHALRLDRDTMMKRRVYELLLAAKCPALEVLDGLKFDKQAVERKDEVWELLVQRGVVEPVERDVDAAV